MKPVCTAPQSHRPGRWLLLGLALPLLSALAMGCGKEGRTLMHHYKTLPGGAWSTFDTLRFDIPPSPTTEDYVFSLGLRLRNTFPYEDIWMVAEMHLEEPAATVRDTLRYLTTQPDGSPQGHGIALQQDEQPLCTLRLARGQHGHLRLYHIMTREIMPDVANVGVRSEKLRTKN